MPTLPFFLATFALTFQACSLSEENPSGDDCVTASEKIVECFGEDVAARLECTPDTVDQILAADSCEAMGAGIGGESEDSVGDFLCRHFGFCLLGVNELGPEDKAGEPYDGLLGSDDPIPEMVDHSSLFGPVRNQGSRSACMGFAWSGAVEGYYGLTEPLSAEQVYSGIPASTNFLHWKLEGLRIAKDVDWPYDTSKPEGVEEVSYWGIDSIKSVGTNSETLKRYLASRENNNIVLSVAWDHSFVLSGGILADPQLGTLAAAWRTATCDSRESCGGHSILVVGYIKREFEGVEQTFFKFRNSWGPEWGDSGHGYMSEEYLHQLGKAAYLVVDGPKVN